MDLRTATDCGNSPRMALVAELISGLGIGGGAPVQEWLAEGSPLDPGRHGCQDAIAEGW